MKGQYLKIYHDWHNEVIPSGWSVEFVIPILVSSELVKGKK